MKFMVKGHWLYQDDKRINCRMSPNHGGIITPEIIIEHFTGDNGKGGLNWLCQKGSGVSAHLWIGKDGEIWQLLPFNVRGWHAGRSEWDGRSDCNSWSVGIENQGLGDIWPATQIEANIGIVLALLEAYPSIVEVVGHEDVAMPPGRKTDPGPKFPWEIVYKALIEAGYYE